MTLISFKNDYSEGAHPNILNAIMETNLYQLDGYGEDPYSIQAASIIKEKLGTETSDIHFVAGGTLANIIFISSVLKPYHSVISANTGHISVHEAGAIEASGHKINVVNTEDGKLTPENIEPIIQFHTDEHMVKPAMVYITNATEIGTIYKKKELERLSAYCKSKGLVLYIDGARLSSALTSRENDMTLKELSSLVDAFYIGGTKNGALFGEAIVINNKELMQDFRYNIKQKGGLLAKGRLLGIQFLELFKNDLHLDLAKHANEMAHKLSCGLEELNIPFLSKSQTNQIFPIFHHILIKKLSDKFDFYEWKKMDDENSAIRLVTSWATRAEAVNSFISDVKLYVDSRIIYK
jgi:threonine aldolase